jgi:DNA-binding HxlR family transcriptional regulator
VSTRSYKQHCGIARALDLVGERWALLIIRELVVGPKRFTDLRDGLPGIATNVLSDRLRQLELDGIIMRRRLPPPAASTVYELSEYGRDLVPIILALGRWGARTMGPPRAELTSRPEWLAVALQAFYEPQAAKGLAATVQLDLDGASFALRFSRGGLEVTPGTNGVPDLTIATDPQTLVAYLSGADVPLHAEGNLELLGRLRAIFPFGD